MRESKEADRRRRRKGAKKVEANKNSTTGPLCVGSLSKRSRRRTAVSLPEGHREKMYCKERRVRNGKCMLRVADEFSKGRIFKCQSRTCFSYVSFFLNTTVYEVKRDGKFCKRVLKIYEIETKK